MNKKIQELYLGIEPETWRLLEQIPKPLKISKFDGTFEGQNYQGHSDHFIEFVEEHIYAPDRKTNEYKPFKFAKRQKSIVREAITVAKKILRYIVIVFCWPKRHGKTQIFSYYDIYRAVNYKNQRITIGSNSAAQTEETAYWWVVSTILNSPNLKKRVDAGLIRITVDKITFLETGSRIIRVTSNAASAYGQRISVAHITEMGEARDRKFYDALAGSIGDSRDGVILADSVVGAADNIVCDLIHLFEEGGDPGLFVSYIKYDSLSDAIKRNPDWIDERWLRSRFAQMLPGEFKRYHLNQPSSGSDLMFDREEWQACILPGLRAPLFPEYINKNIKPRMQNETVLFGVGLDRAQSYSKNPDRTVLTLVAKGFLKPKYFKKTEKTITDSYGDIKETEYDPAEYWILDSVEIPRSNDAEIKRLLLEWQDRYRVSNNAFERYETDDLSRWCERKGFPVEPVSPSALNQRDAFDLLYRAAVQGRLWIPDSLWLLIYEGYYFSVDYSNVQPHFGHKSSFKANVEINGIKQKVFLKDDAMKSLAWAIWGLREKISPPVSWFSIADSMPSGREENQQIMDSYMEEF